MALEPRLREMIKFWMIPFTALALLSHFCNGAENLFGVFDFDLRGETHGEQIQRIEKIGYDGFAVVLNTPSALKTFEQRLAEQAKMKVIVGLFQVHCDTPEHLNRPHLKNVVKALAQHKAKLWLSINGPKDEEKIIRLIQEVADAAAEKNVTVSLYPHDNTAMETAEEALMMREKSGRQNLTISIHQCHEMRAGNTDRLADIIAKVGSHLDLVTICGSNIKMSKEEKNWDDAIKPLGEGDYDPKKFLRLLTDASFKGPVILHTYGLKKKPDSHYQTSFEIYQKMVAEITREKSSK